MYPNDPELNQQIAMLEQEFAQRKANVVQSFYNQKQSGWGQQNTQAAQQQSNGQNVNWIYVSGVDGAKNQIVQPGQSAWMMDNNDPYFYVKEVDSVGSSTFRIFQFAEVQDVLPEQGAQPQIDLSQYVQRGEFDKLKEQFDQFANVGKKVSTKTNKEAVDNG